MGFNSTIVVMNDAVGDIEKDPDFGKNLARAIASGKTKVDVRAGSSINAATVISNNHADYTSLVAVGGNCGTYLTGVYSFRHNEEAVQVELLKAFADKLGYKVVKKSPTVPNES